MGSMSNPNPWSPYDSYNDCSQGVCNIYCPQWCYLIFPPPPPSFLNDEDEDSPSSFSPLLIALIVTLVTAFILVSYYTLVSKYCRRPSRETSSSDGRNITESNSNAVAGDGLNDALIKSITVYKYKKGDGHVDGSDCSVCLSEFEEDESLRLLPKCNHAFHLPCIDTWLRSHSNCPLCRAFVTGINNPITQSNAVHPIATESVNRGGGGAAEVNLTAAGYDHRTGDSVVVVEDLEIGLRSQPPEEQRDATKDEEDPPPRIRRSVSLIADVLREIDDEVSAGVGTSQQRQREEDGDGEGKTPKSSMGMKRSVSTGRFIFSRHDRARNYSLPN